jgi:hypothetical protein
VGWWDQHAVALSRCRLTVGFHLDRAGSFDNHLLANSSFLTHDV